jgi:hypothetical protein
MSTISGLGNGASRLLALLQERPDAAPAKDKTAGGSGATPASAAPGTAVQGSGSSDKPLAAALLSELVQMQAQPTQGLQSPLPPSGQQLFAALDSNGDGRVSQSELESALTRAGSDTNTADAILKKVDANGDAMVSQTELASGMHQGHHHHHHHMVAAANGSSRPDPLATLLQADSTGQDAAAGDEPATSAPAA